MEPMLYLNEEYGERCGEIFLTNLGSLIFHCTLCDNISKGFERYNEHIKEHFFTKIENEEDETQFFEDFLKDSEDDTSEAVLIESRAEYLMEETEIFDLKVEEAEEVDSNEAENDEVVSEVVIEKLSPEEHVVFEDNKESNDVEEVPTNADPLYTSDIGKKRPLKIDLSEGLRELHKRDHYNRTPVELRKHICPICGSGYKDKVNMYHHIRRHAKKRNYDCPECDKSYFTGSELKVHMRKHTGDCPYLCCECGVSFKKKSDLDLHLKKHKNQRDFHCSDCEKSFFTAWRLKEHTRVHQPRQHHICKICKSGYVSDHNLKLHMKTHENKREYKCDVCSARFNLSTGLRNHLKRVHKKFINEKVKPNIDNTEDETEFH